MSEFLNANTIAAFALDAKSAESKSFGDTVD